MPIATRTSRHWNTGEIAHGSEVNAANTGIAGAGLDAGDLTTTAGTTYSTNGQTIEGRRFTSTVTITGDNVTLRNCLFDFAGGASTRAIIVGAAASGALVENCTVAPASGSYYHGVLIDGAVGTTIRACDIARCENAIEDDGDDTVIELSFLHIGDATSNPGGHVDYIEVYAGDNHTIRRNRIGDDTVDVTAAINVAPWYSAVSVDGVDIDDNFIDGGNVHVLVDLQSSGSINNVRVRRNKMGGHTNVGVFGRYAPLQNNDSRDLVDDDAAQALDPDAILWPSSGADVNTWDECSDLTPDNTGDAIIPAG